MNINLCSRRSVAGPVKMPKQGEQFDVPGNAVVSGWGTLSSGGSSPDELYSVTVPLVSDKGKYTFTYL